MKKILFVCHGNICRSPMAEYMFKKLVKDKGLEKEYEVDSAGTSIEESGNDIYPPAKQTLYRHGVPFEKRQARQMSLKDYHYYDRIYVMDAMNLRNMSRILPKQIVESEEYGEKVRMLMSLTGSSRDVADPWYSGDFEKTYKDIDSAIAYIL